MPQHTQIPFSIIKNIEAQAAQIDDVISLSQGALKIGGIPQIIKNHLQTILTSDITDYYQSAWGIPALREAIALSLKHNLTVDNIIVTHGAMGALTVLAMALIHKGDEVILPEPTYPAYNNILQLRRATPRWVSCIDSDGTVIADDIFLERVTHAITRKTKAIIFSNPSNPLGTQLKHNTIAKLAEYCETHGVYLIIDEVYRTYTQPPFASIAPHISDSSHIIMLDSFSKSFSMSGWRIGYMAIPRRLEQMLGRMQDTLLNCPNVLVQHAALCALTYPKLVTSFKSIIDQNRQLLMSYAPTFKQNLNFSLMPPSAGIFAFMKTPYDDTTEWCRQLLKRQRVSLVPGSAFGPSGASFIRLCFARLPQTLTEGLSRLLVYQRK